jgi:hypothetical protein
MSLLAVVLGTGLLLAGCQASGAKSQAPPMPGAQAVTCSKCQVTWVRTPISGGTHQVTRYTTRKSMTCPDCEAAVNAYFSAYTGKWDHACKTCGDSLQVCESH